MREDAPYRIFGWIAALLDGSPFLASGNHPYDIEVIDKSTGQCLYSEGPYYGASANHAQEQFAKALASNSVVDFIYKREHGWRTVSR